MNALILYNSYHTFTNTVYEHLDALRKYSRQATLFHHCDPSTQINFNLQSFDIVIVHYSVRLPFDQVSSVAEKLREFNGVKALFIQDEYDHTHRAWHWIRHCGFNLVFTVVPENNIGRIYPAEEFPGVDFVGNLTGYVPESGDFNCIDPPSKRSLLVGYRGRPLPLRYGGLGLDKVRIAQLVKTYCEANALSHDIAWSETDRIYGDAWYQFMGRCRAILGTESGCNIFDWDGQIDRKIAAYRRARPGATDEEIFRNVIEPNEHPGLMNQLSPKIFEAIACGSVMILFEGEYSGAVKPDVHYIPLKKDGGNLEAVFDRLRDGPTIDEMVKRARADVIDSGRYSYQTFVRMVDENLERVALSLPARRGAKIDTGAFLTELTKYPRREAPVTSLKNAIFGAESKRHAVRRVIQYLWKSVPEPIRNSIPLGLSSSWIGGCGLDGARPNQQVGGSGGSR